MQNIAPLYNLAFMAGVAPYSLDAQSVKHKKVPSIILRLPTYLMIIFYSICVCSVFWKQNALSELSATANWIQFIPNAVIFIIILINGERTKTIIGSVGIVVEQLDDKLRLFQISFTRSYIRTKRTTIFVCILIIVCGICVLLLQYLIGVDSYKASSIFYWLSFCIPKIGLMIFNFLFACYMMILLERLTMLGKALSEMTSYRIKRVFPRQNGNNLNRLTTLSNVVMPPINDQDVVNTIFEIVEKFQEISNKLNKYFGKKVIFTILTAFICLTVQLFYLINHIRHGFPTNKSVLASIGSCSLISMHVLELWAIFFSGHKIKEMWSSLVKTIQDTKRKYDSDEVFKSRIDELVNTMVFTRVELRAAGFFPLDLSVVTSIVSSIATYLIVLVQFKLSEDESNDGQTYQDD
ncbi:unnamed protein product, partial [Diamesa serratosioi]